MTPPNTDELRSWLGDIAPWPWQHVGPQESGWDIETEDGHRIANFYNWNGFDNAANAEMASLSPELAAKLVHVFDELHQLRTELYRSASMAYENGENWAAGALDDAIETLDQLLKEDTED